jgi:argininosuccinate lyase
VRRKPSLPTFRLLEHMTEPLWMGRFAKSPAPDLQAFSRSLHFDRRLWPQDVQCTGAHAAALERAGILTTEEKELVDQALASAAASLADGTFQFEEADEDIHSALERFLTAELGEVGAKIHAGRSRNDLVVTDLRLWLKSAILAIAGGVHRLQQALVDQSRAHENVLAPGYTHLQRAQPVLLPHLLLAHCFALGRDFERLMEAYRHADMSCLGAAAFAGTSLPLDPVETARELGFSTVFQNAADAVSSRDFALMFLSAAAILGVNLSRLGEEVVIWTSDEFGFASLDDAYATGSSIMPQKKNPDVAELARAKAARLTGDLVHLLGVLKGLPLAYNRDLQEDKEPVFDAADCLIGTLAALTGAIETVTFDYGRLDEAARGQSVGATDLAEALVMQGVPFRLAHEAVGKLVARAEALGNDLTDVSEETLAAFHPSLTPGMLQMLDPRISVNARSSHGGTAPVRIAEQLASLEAKLDLQRELLDALRVRGT